jgi:hypothetical protein
MIILIMNYKYDIYDHIIKVIEFSLSYISYKDQHVYLFYLTTT